MCLRPQVQFFIFIFLPKYRSTGKGRGFGFVRFKTEQDANRAIQTLNGRVVCGRRFGVQIAKVLNKNINYPRPSEAVRRLESVSVNQFHGRVYSNHRHSIINVEKGNEQVLDRSGWS